MKWRMATALALALALAGSLVYAQSRVVRWTIPITDTGIFLASCGEEFDILYDDNMVAHGMVVLDKDGNPAKYTEIYKVIGTSHYYNSTDSSKFIDGGPGEVQQVRILFDENGNPYGRNFAGLIFKVIIPGYGPILMETGTFRMRSGQVVFNSGWNQVLDNDVAALCDYLR